MGFALDHDRDMPHVDRSRLDDEFLGKAMTRAGNKLTDGTVRR